MTIPFFIASKIVWVLIHPETWLTISLAFDPQGVHEGSKLLPGMVWQDDTYVAVEGADAVLILTKWNQFRALDLRRIAELMVTPMMADLRNMKWSCFPAQVCG